MTYLIDAAAILKDIIIWDCRNLYKNSNSDNEVIHIQVQEGYITEKLRKEDCHVLIIATWLPFTNLDNAFDVFI